MKIVFLDASPTRRVTRERSVDLPTGVTDVDALRRWLGEEIPALLDPSVRMIVNNVLAHRGQRIAPDDEIAFFPPVSGG